VETVLIDVFLVPEEAREEFRSKVHFSANYLKTLPGFVEGYVYERAAGSSRFNVVTTAVWESEKAMEEARKSAAAAFQQAGFNPPEIMKRLGVQIERAEYARKPY
jgi:heme-degrading monooxygenase HmoA